MGLWTDLVHDLCKIGRWAPTAPMIWMSILNNSYMNKVSQFTRWPVAWTGHSVLYIFSKNNGLLGWRQDCWQTATSSFGFMDRRERCGVCAFVDSHSTHTLNFSHRHNNEQTPSTKQACWFSQSITSYSMENSIQHDPHEESKSPPMFEEEDECRVCRGPAEEGWVTIRTETSRSFESSFLRHLSSVSSAIAMLWC